MSAYDEIIMADRSLFDLIGDGPPPKEAVYDYSEAGALLLAYDQDDAFTALLRETVPKGFLTWSRRPYHWVIDEDYAADALAIANDYFEYVTHGTIGDDLWHKDR